MVAVAEWRTDARPDNPCVRTVPVGKEERREEGVARALRLNAIDRRVLCLRWTTVEEIRF
eukprot:2156854-Rhodomonas_salina.2